MAKLATLVDAFTAAAVNTSLWNLNTGGAVTLDTVNDVIVLAHPTVNGAVNTFGTSSTYDATSSAIYAEVGPAANGNGFTRTVFKVLLDANNSVAIRLISGVLNLTLQTAGTTVTTQIAATYDPNAHGWWRLRESGGSWNADVSADGLNWSTLFTTAYSWSAAAVSFVLQTSAGATEAAGNVATIQHVNTMLGGPFNINWPVLEEGWGAGWTCNGGDIPLDQFTSVTARTEGQLSSSRGKQYELDQMQAGTASSMLANKDGWLDPDNAAGPYAGHILPAQPWRRRAQWPPTRNLLTQVQATGGDLGGYPLGAISASNSGPSIFSGSDAAHGSFVTSASAWAGGTCMQFAVPSGTLSGITVLLTPQPAVTPGVRYTMTIQVRNITASTSLQVQAFMATHDAPDTLLTLSSGSPTTLTGGASAAWTQLTVSAVMDSSTAYCRFGVLLSATAAATCAVQVDGWQVEQAAVASTWACPGAWKPVATGFTDDWAADWSMGGTYGTIAPTLYDVFGLLSQRQLTDALTAEITSRSPRFLFALDDPSGSATATDSTGNFVAASKVNSKYGAGAFTFGNAIAAAATTGTYVGSAGTVAAVDNANPGTNTAGAATFLSLASAGIYGPGSTAWTRMIAFRYRGSSPASAATLWSAADKNVSGGSQFLMNLQATNLVVQLSGPTSGATVLGAGGSAMVDGNWHLAFLGYDGVDKIMLSTDGATSTYTGYGAIFNPTGCVSDAVAANANTYTGNAATQNYKGDLSFVAEFPAFLSASDCTAIYTAWKSACAGESTDARYARILHYGGYIGPSSLQAGQTRSMGVCAFAGQDALSALQDVVTTENGNHFAARDGTITFQSRGARYNSLTPVYTFGENAASGEWPYENAKPTRDNTHLSNIVTVTQAATGQTFTAQNTAAQTAYFPKTMTRTINSTSTAECQDAADYLLSRYVAPLTRIQTLLLHPSANPAMWPVCLSLELGMRVRVMRRPPAPAPAIQVDCFIEKIDVTFDNGGEAWWTLQCSPVDPTPYGIYSSFHTTLHTTISANAASITIDAGQDNTNRAAAQLGVGQQLVLGNGTANVETVTIQAVAATSPGWTTCVITLAANTTKAHTAGDVICEPLPAGTTDPTTWDAVSKFDSTAFAY